MSTNQLVVQTPWGPLTRKPIVIGRSTQMQEAVGCKPPGNISRRHVALWLGKGGTVVMCNDAGSLCGTSLATPTKGGEDDENPTLDIHPGAGETEALIHLVKGDEGEPVLVRQVTGETILSPGQYLVLPNPVYPAPEVVFPSHVILSIVAQQEGSEVYDLRLQACSVIAIPVTGYPSEFDSDEVPPLSDPAMPLPPLGPFPPPPSSSVPPPRSGSPTPPTPSPEQGTNPPPAEPGT